MNWNEIYIDGSWRAPRGGGTTTLRDSSTEEVFAEVALAGVRDVEDAVLAAERARDSWATTPVKERRDYLAELRDALAPRLSHLTTDIARQVGMPLPTAAMFQTGAAHAVLSSYVDLLEIFPFAEQIGHSLVLREPAGVVAAITPWNYPLYQIVVKVVAALAAGCTVVLKPSEIAPLAGFVVADLIDRVGFPPGVFNLVPGLAPVGEALVAHPAVEVVSFTGSTAVGRAVASVAGQGLKRTVLELGGKSANIVLADADLAEAVTAGLLNAYLNSGQTCFAWTRLLVPRDRLAEAEAIAAAVAESLVLGNPLLDGTQLGPVVTAVQRERVRDYIRLGLAEGARLVTGGVDAPAGLDRGYFVRPTVFGDVDRRMRISQEEIFGPVLVVLPYRDVDDAVAIANGTPYGLHGAVWSADRARAVAVARRLRTGMVDVNGAPLNVHAPFGGWKQSGIDREGGRYGLEAFLQYKAVQLNQPAEAS
ncbi:MAG: aldehyde dehydrogenase family protein [Sporichthyaceae bacterium]